MENQNNAQPNKRKLKFLMIAPVVLIPFLALIFWGLGGGKGENGSDGMKTTDHFNTALPQPNIKDKDWDKFKFYEQAKSDSLKRVALIKEDPYYQRWLNFESKEKDTFSVQSLNQRHFSNGLVIQKDSNEEKIQNKIAQINAQLQEPKHPEAIVNQPRPQQAAVDDNSVDRLERMMLTMKNNEPDPEMEQLNEVLDKLSALQHPELFSHWQKESEKQPEQVFAVRFPSTAPVTLLSGTSEGENNGVNVSGNGFYSFGETENLTSKQTAVPAMVYGTQRIGDKSTIVLKLLKEVFINGVLIPANHPIVGDVAFSENSIQILVHQIVYNERLFPVSLRAYSLNGIKGIAVSGNIAGDFAKQTADQAAQRIAFTPSVSSLGGEAINAGLQAAKSLITKKTKPVFITVPSGTVILLSDRKN